MDVNYFSPKQIIVEQPAKHLDYIANRNKMTDAGKRDFCKDYPEVAEFSKQLAYCFLENKRLMWHFNKDLESAKTEEEKQTIQNRIHQFEIVQSRIVAYDPDMPIFKVLYPHEKDTSTEDKKEAEQFVREAGL